ncbi:MAG: mechanosensitive ion channel family protein [Proteobacteria bacterium]|nr:mechanosensitive ion channel family protein [Pseudomonadota bacterium]
MQAIGLEQIKKLAGKARLSQANLFLDTLKQTKFLVLLLISLFIGSHGLTLPENAQTLIRSAAIIALLMQAGFWSVSLLNGWLEHYRATKLAKDPAAVTSMTAMGFIARLGIWAAILLLILDNLGIDVTALVAGLGIGGIAVALAVQNILSDLFASLTIVLDKPFVVGDFLILGPEHLGNVENIGLKTTRLRSLSGEQIIVSNSDLLAARVRNYGRMFERRIPVIIGVTYQTPREKLEKIPQIIRAAIEAQDKTRFDRAHFMRFGDFSLDFEYVYYVKSANYNDYMDANQAINLYIHEIFEKEGIEFAYPTQSLFVEKIPDRKTA